MSKSKHTEEQIIAAIQQLKAGRMADAVAERMGYRSTRSTLGTLSMAGWK